MDREIALKIRSIFDRILFLEKSIAFHFEGIKLYPSEIHAILHIHKSEGEARNATMIAENIGVTKGAISQTLSRLEKKGIVTKVKDPYNKNELVLSFTAKGEKALGYILALHKKFQERHNTALAEFLDRDKEIIMRYLSKLEEIIHR